MSIWKNSIRRSNTSLTRLEPVHYGNFLVLKHKRSLQTWDDDHPECDEIQVPNRHWYFTYNW